MKILVFVDYYTPGYRAGGAARSILNLVESLGDQIEFYIVTRDRDIGMNNQYQNVKTNEWVKVGLAQVYYVSPEMISFTTFLNIAKSIDYDVLYLNSFFSPFTTIRMILLHTLKLIKNTPVILAPRGEFSKGALEIKTLKKQLYLYFFKKFINLTQYSFQASTELEADDIKYSLLPDNKKGKDIRVIIARDCLFQPRDSSNFGERKKYGAPLSIIFLSRIAPIKNLDFLLQILKGVKSQVVLSIYGPLEFPNYWEDCEKLVNELPENVVVQYKGDVHTDLVASVFAEHDVFFFPTRGENFGHVIFESVAAGTCVVLSDQTLWKPDSDGAIEIIPLDNNDGWIEAVEKWADYSESTLLEKRQSAVKYSIGYLKNDPSINENITLFEKSVKLLVTDT